MAEKVFLVDDDADVRDAVSMLLSTADHKVEVFSTAQELLDRIKPEDAGCMVLDVRLPGMDGLELQRALYRQGIRMPVIFITGHGDIPMAVRAVNAGALDFLEKPFDDDKLLERVEEALANDREQREIAERRATIEERLATLTPREREVMEEILKGKLNKVIAADLDLSTRTVEVHRARILEKLHVRNVSAMVRLVLSTPEYKDWLL